jgi:hypothetical protein
VLDDTEEMKRTLRAIGLMAGRWAQANIGYSQYTDKFYVTSPLSITDMVVQSGIVEHRSTPEAAVIAYWQRLQSCTLGGKDYVRIAREDTILGAQYDSTSDTFLYLTLAEMQALTNN